MFKELKQSLKTWQHMTKDPWICAPHGVLEDKGIFKNNPRCMPLYNEIVDQKNMASQDKLNTLENSIAPTFYR